tara:strand:+ start:152 stop:643 length:492 start_codon:yes stop_codon:yes gene_type:complete
MGKIKPTLTIVSNAASATTDPGPLSFALNLTAKPHSAASYALDVTKVESKIMTLTAGSEADATHRVFDASTFTSNPETANDGGFVYLKNLLADPGDATHNIMIGHKTGAKDLDTDGEADRLMTLRPGEFAFFPWDFTEDIIADVMEDNTNQLEAWLFVRTTTA